MEITKFVTKGMSVEDGEIRKFSGYMSAECIDKDGEIIAQQEILKCVGKWMKCGAPISDSHSNRIVGKGLSYEAAEYEGVPAVKMVGEIYNEYLLHDMVWKAIKSGEYAGLSIGGASMNTEPVLKEDGGYVIKLSDLEIYEVAVCAAPANPLAIIDKVNHFAKALGMTPKIAGDRPIIQCDTIHCVDKYSHQQGERAHISNDDNQKPEIGNTTPRRETKVEEGVDKNYISNLRDKGSMSETDTAAVIAETLKTYLDPIKAHVEKLEKAEEARKMDEDKKERDEEMKKTFETILAPVLETVKAQGEAIEALKTNPGGEGDRKEMTSGGETKLGDGEKLNSADGVSGMDTAASGSNPGPEVTSKSDDKDDKKDDMEKADDKKDEEVEKADDKEDKDDVEKAEKITFANGYEMSKTATPRPPTMKATPTERSAEQTATGYDLLKAVRSGFGAEKGMMAPDALKQARQEYEKGTFGRPEKGGLP